MKKILCLILVVGIVLLGGCAPTKEAEKPIKLAGMNNFEAHNGIEGGNVPKPTDKLIIDFYESTTDLALAITTGKADIAVMPDALMARYIMAKNDKIGSKPTGRVNKMHMGVPLGQEELRAELNKGIQVLKANGKLDTLIKTWIDNPPKDADMKPQTLPVIQGAKTYKVGLTGQMPPVDFMTADGKPAGFNISLLSALSEELGINFEIVVVENSARLVALETGKIDIMFYSLNFVDRPTLDNVLLLLTDEYYTGEVAIIGLKGTFEKKADAYISQLKATGKK